MVSSVYGKVMGNLRKRTNISLVNNKKYFLKYNNRPSYITHKTFGKNYAAIYETEPVLAFNKPIYVGFTVLELSKWLMYDFHSQFDAELFYTATHSLIYKIKSEDFYKVFLSTNICLTLVTIQNIQSFIMRLIKKLLVKWKTCQKEKQIMSLLD